METVADGDAYPKPTIGAVRYNGAMADRKSYTVPVTYPGEATVQISFTGSVHGCGPVVMITPAFPRGDYVVDPERFGERFDAEWVRTFFA